MSVDESGAPWPYEEIDPAEEIDEKPTWVCPGGQCACHAAKADEAERVEHKLVFFDHVTKRMPGARCRVLENGILLNKDTPYADGSGAITVKVRPTSHSLRLEWAPSDTPVKPRYPFRKTYHIDVGESRDDGVARRLHNLGFASYSSLEENIRDFQTTYRKPATGDPADVEPTLIDYHDNSNVPPVPKALRATPAQGDKLSLAPDKGSDVGGSEANAKKGPDEKAGPKAGGPPQPGQSPGKKTQGSPTGKDTTKVKIELHIAFALHVEDFAAKDDVTWSDLGYDPVALLDEIYPKITKEEAAQKKVAAVNKRDFRLGGKGGYPIAEATLTRMELDSEEQQKTGKDGSVTFDLGDLEGKPTSFILLVRPPPNQESPTGKPAGPALTDKDTTATRYFRKFALWLEVDDQGALLPDKVRTIQPPGNPRHAKIIEVTKGPKSGNNVIVVDWRPDWIKSGEETSRRPRRTNKVNMPTNPFETPRTEAELEAAPPGIILHQTGTTNLSFLPGFISDANGEKTSIHYVVDYDGFVIKVLDEHYRANHAGASLWEQRGDLNEITVGIETMHSDTDPPSPTNNKFSIKPRRYTKEQYDAFARLLAEIEQEYSARRRRVRGHMEVLLTPVFKRDAAGEIVKDAKGKPVVDHHTGVLSRDRVGCPGPYFEWQRLEEAKTSVALAPVPVPAKSPDPKLDAVFQDLEKLKKIGTIAAGTKSAEVKILKQLLFDIGYSVSSTLPQLTKRDDVVTLRANLSNDLDTAMTEAVRAFQTHHFSGRRRAYKILNATIDASFPAAGTVDQATIDKIMETWFAAMTQTT